MALVSSELPALKLLNRGKVRDVYEVDAERLLFVATDRLSAFDVVMLNGVPGKGKILTQLSLFWFELLKDVIGNHVITADIEQMPDVVRQYRSQLEGRVMLVRRLRILPVEAIVRGYISGSGWVEYKKSSTICSLPLPAGLQESEKLPKTMFTPSTKAEVGEHDENIHPDKAAEIIGEANAAKVAAASVELYERSDDRQRSFWLATTIRRFVTIGNPSSIKARDYAAVKGIIIADTKFEFGLDDDANVVLADEVLTPDSSRFWPASDYRVGRSQNSLDKQYVRDYLLSINFDKKNGVQLPDDVIHNTQQKYLEVYRILTGKEAAL